MATNTNDDRNTQNDRSTKNDNIVRGDKGDRGDARSKRNRDDKDKNKEQWSPQQWNFLDAIYCINLSSRPDRRAIAQKVFDEYHIPVKMMIVEKHPTSGQQGCFESHLRIIREALEKKYQRILIFEDDIVTTPYLTRGKLREVVRFMKTNQQWDLFYLGPMHDIRHYSAKWINHSIYQLRSCGTHAYCLSKRMIEKMAKLEYTGVAIDDVYKYGDYKRYAIYPSLFNQGSQKSDIAKQDFYNWQQFSPLKQGYFRGIEMYTHYINIPLNQFKWILFTLILLLYLWLLIRYCHRTQIVKYLTAIFIPILILLALIQF